MSHKVTLKDVAARAGVSYQTVSKVLRKQAQVSPETEARIRQAVEDLGYRPDYGASSMRSRRSHAIGYSWDPTPLDQMNPILDLFLQSMVEAADEEDYQLVCFPHHADRPLEPYFELMASNRVDGFVLSGIEYDDPRVAYLVERGFPFVAFGRSNPDWIFPCVDVDNTAGMYALTKHLVDLGHRRIAVLAWPESSRVGQDRMRGYLRALEEAGIDPESDWIARGEGKFSFGLEQTRVWLGQDPALRPSAIIGFNDSMAVGALRAALEQGIAVGEELAIAGYDDTPLGEYVTPSLTSVRQPIWEVGQTVVSVLLDQLGGGAVGEGVRLLKPTLVLRESTEGSQMNKTSLPLSTHAG
jgi:DNA-binding LacI/PurR family transcriptional regulator